MKLQQRTAVVSKSGNSWVTVEYISAAFATVYNRTTEQCSKLPFPLKAKAKSNIKYNKNKISEELKLLAVVNAAVNTIIARAVANYMQQATKYPTPNGRKQQ